MAGKRRSFARWTSFSICAAPSSRLYSEWTWRWTNSLCCIAHFRAHFRAFEVSARPSNGLTSYCHLLPFDRRRRLGRDVENHPIDALHLVDDPVADRAQEIVWQSPPVRGHRVLAHDRPPRHDLGIGAEVAHAADGQDRQSDI